MRSIGAKIITIEDMRLLLINVYMPCDDDMDTLEEYSSILREISGICIKSLTPMIIIGGDWNADPIRNDERTKLFKEFIKHEKLSNALYFDIANRNGNITTSTLSYLL